MTNGSDGVGWMMLRCGRLEAVTWVTLAACGGPSEPLRLSPDEAARLTTTVVAHLDKRVWNVRCLNAEPAEVSPPCPELERAIDEIKAASRQAVEFVRTLEINGKEPTTSVELVMIGHADGLSYGDENLAQQLLAEQVELLQRQDVPVMVEPSANGNTAVLRVGTPYRKVKDAIDPWLTTRAPRRSYDERVKTWVHEEVGGEYRGLEMHLTIGVDVARDDAEIAVTGFRRIGLNAELYDD